jgi:hypothetical protein
MEDEDEEDEDDDDDLQKKNAFHFQQAIKIICFKYFSRIIFISFYYLCTTIKTIDIF